jgi:hypothetical protein
MVQKWNKSISNWIYLCFKARNFYYELLVPPNIVHVIPKIAMWSLLNVNGCLKNAIFFVIIRTTLIWTVSFFVFCSNNVDVYFFHQAHTKNKGWRESYQVCCVQPEERSTFQLKSLKYKVQMGFIFLLMLN